MCNVLILGSAKADNYKDLTDTVIVLYGDRVANTCEHSITCREVEITVLCTWNEYNIVNYTQVKQNK